MITSRYETHKIQSSVLPFIFHPKFKIKQKVMVPNWHKNIEFLRCIDGEGFVRCDAAVYPLKKNSLVTVNSDVLHAIGTQSEVEYRCLILDHTFFLSNGIPIETLSFSPVLESSEILELFDRVCQSFLELDPEDFKSVAHLRSEVMRFCVALCEFSSYKAAEPREDNYVKEAIFYIRQNLFSPISLEQIASTVGVSKFHLARQFKKYTGATIIQTVNQMRCTEAQRMLEQGMSVSAAASACGYSNPSYFSRTFFSVMGRLPSQI